MSETTGERSQEPSAEWLSGRPDPEKKGEKNTATKEQNSLAASLRTCSSFSWSEYSRCATATAAAARAQTGTRRPYDREIKYSTEKPTQGGREPSLRLRTHILFVLLNSSSTQSASHEKAEHDEWLSEAE